MKDPEKTLPQNQQEHLEELSSEKISYDDLTRRAVRSLIFHLLYAMESFDYQESLEAILKIADRALYKAKKSGRNRCIIK